MAGANCSGVVVCTAGQGPHQCPGAVGSGIGAPPFPPTSTRQACVGEVRQHKCSLSYQSHHGGNQVREVANTGSETSDMGCSTVSQSEGGSYSRCTEHVCRLSITPGPNARGVEAAPGGSGTHLGDLWQSGSGRTLLRVLQEGHRLLLVAPFCPARIWFPLLRRLCCSSLMRLPFRRDLLSQLGGRILHPDPNRLQLWVWPLQGPTQPFQSLTGI